MLTKHDLLLKNPGSYRCKFPWKITSKISFPLGTSRELASSFFQLKIGYGYLKSYLYRLGHSISDLCWCGHKETIKHLLLSCKELKEARRKLQDSLGASRLNLRLLLHTTTGIEKTLNFLKETRVVTRKWHLERKEEVREVGEKELDELVA